MSLIFCIVVKVVMVKVVKLDFDEISQDLVISHFRFLMKLFASVAVATMRNGKANGILKG